MCADTVLMLSVQQTFQAWLLSTLHSLENRDFDQSTQWTQTTEAEGRFELTSLTLSSSSVFLQCKYNGLNCDILMITLQRLHGNIIVEMGLERHLQSLLWIHTPFVSLQWHLYVPQVSWMLLSHTGQFSSMVYSTNTCVTSLSPPAPQSPISAQTSPHQYQLCPEVSLALYLLLLTSTGDPPHHSWLSQPLFLQISHFGPSDHSQSSESHGDYWAHCGHKPSQGC